MNQDLLNKIYLEFYKIRAVEEAIADKYSDKEMRCPVHLSIGQEVVSAVFSQVVKKRDFLVSTHRSHSHYLAKGGNLKKMIAEIYGKNTGCSKGKGGSMHLVDLKVNFMGSSPIVANIIPIGVGLGLSSKLKKSDQICYIFFGDGAVEEGAFYESLNFAVVKQIPAIFICENNLYSVYTKLSDRQPRGRKITSLAKSIGLKSLFCEGNNIKKIYKVLKYAEAQVRKNSKPIFLEFSSYRWREHCGPNFDNNIGYRKEKEYLEWKRKDPMLAIKKNLTKSFKNKNNLLIKVNKINNEISEAFKFAKRSSFPKLLTAYDGEYCEKKK